MATSVSPQPFVIRLTPAVARQHQPSGRQPYLNTTQLVNTGPHTTPVLNAPSPTSISASRRVLNSSTSQNTRYVTSRLNTSAAVPVSAAVPAMPGGPHIPTAPVPVWPGGPHTPTAPIPVPGGSHTPTAPIPVPGGSHTSTAPSLVQVIPHPNSGRRCAKWSSHTSTPTVFMQPPMQSVSKANTLESRIGEHPP